MKKILLSAVAAATLATSASALVLTGTAQTVSSQGLTTSSVLEFDDINVTLKTTYAANDTMQIATSAGEFQSDTYYLINTADTGAVDQMFSFLSKSSDGKTLTFRCTADSNSTLNAIDSTFVLSSQNAVLGSGNEDVNISNTTIATAGTITVTANSYVGTTEIDTAGTETVTLVTGADQFDANVSTAANATIDVAASRVNFTGSSTADQIKIGITDDTSLTNSVTLNASDAFSLVLSGETDGISSATLSQADGGGTVVTGTIDTAADTITFSTTGSNVDSGANLNDINITVDGTTTLATRSFTVAAEMTLSDESVTEGLLASGTSAGSWSVNGATVEMINMANSGTSVTTALRLINNDTTDAQIFATVTNRATNTAFAEFEMTQTVPATGSVVVTADDIITQAVAAGNTIADGDDFSVSLMVTVSTANLEQIAVQKSGTGQRVLGNSLSDFISGDVD